jgi:hypothetical protein
MEEKSISSKNSIIIKILLIAALFIPAVYANPIPYDFYYRGRVGGNPVPDDQGTDRDIVFKEEEIRFKLNREKASVDADYYFENTGASSRDFSICLPTMENDRDFKVSVEGDEIEHRSGRYYQYQPINENDRYWSQYSDTYMTSILFEITIPANETKMVNVRYRSDVSVYDSTLNSEVMYFFSYLVGSARFWNQSIEKARFEFKMDKGLYDGGIGDYYNRTSKGDDYIFHIEFYNWTPERDFVGISWDQKRPFLEEVARQMEFNGINSTLWCFISLGSIILIISLITTYLIRKGRLNKRSRFSNPRMRSEVFLPDSSHYRNQS